MNRAIRSGMQLRYRLGRVYEPESPPAPLPRSSRTDRNVQVEVAAFEFLAIDANPECEREVPPPLCTYVVMSIRTPRGLGCHAH